jgi:DNA polymerase III epsilon subunit-like protein
MGSELVNEGVMKSSSMDSMCKHFNVKFKGRAHTALTDCQRTVTLWRQLGKYAEAKKFSYEEPYDPHAKANSNARKSL